MAMTGAELRSAREALGLSRSKLARLVPCEGTDWYRWETGRVRITAQRELQIRAALRRATRAAAKAAKAGAVEATAAEEKTTKGESE